MGRAGGKWSRVRLFSEWIKMFAHCETVWRGAGERTVRRNGYNVTTEGLKHLGAELGSRS